MTNQPKNESRAIRAVIGRAGTRGQGPFMEMHLRFDGSMVTEAKFETYGCPTAMRCGDWVAKWAMGRTTASLLLLEPGDLIVVLGGVPLGKEHCAELAVNALRDGLRQIDSKNESEPKGSPL